MAMIYDCASTNNFAIRTLKVLYSYMLGVGYFSHKLNWVDKTFNIPCVNDFTTYWISLFSHSFYAKCLWKEHTGFTIDGYCQTRWWSKWEIMNQLLTVFGDVERFLRSLDDFSGNKRAKLLEYFEIIQTCRQL